MSYKDPIGFTVQHPKGWIIRTNKLTGKMVALGASGEQVIIWPVFLPGQFSRQRAQATLGGLSRQFWPQAMWKAPTGVGTRAMRLAGKSGNVAIRSAISWAPGSNGTAALVYIAAAPEAKYAAVQPAFARIIASFRPVGPASVAVASGGGNLRFVRWREPKEGAWSVEVPAGWTVTGGMFRFAPTDVRSAIEVASPNGLIHVMSGDTRVTTHVLPSAMSPPEGSAYSPGYGVTMMVRRYIPGGSFAAEYAQRLTSLCRNISITSRRDRADAVRAMNQVSQQYAGMVNQRTTAGEVTFTCSGNGTPLRGYYFAATQLTEQSGMGTWSVPLLFGYVAPAADEGRAQEVLRHGTATFEVNTIWARSQQAVTAQTSQIVARTNNEISGLITSTYNANQKTLDEIGRRRSNANLGLTDVRDPATGLETKVESGSNYYWIDNRGRIVGTDQDLKPVTDMAELIQLR